MRVVWWVLLVLLVLFGVVVYIDGIRGRVYVSCPEDQGVVKCVNPYYVCQQPFQTEYPESFCSFFEVCEGELCDHKFLLPGESIGDKPSWLGRNFVIIALLLSMSGLFYEFLRKKLGGVEVGG